MDGDICSICCATGREESIDCPLECPYLQDAHEHERLPELDPASIPNQDIAVDEDFLRANEVVMALISIALFEGVMKNAGTTDWDVRVALECLVQTYRTLESGIHYEAATPNPFAAAVVDSVKEKLADIRRRETEATGTSSVRNDMILGVVAFLQRLEYSRNNGRKRSRAFIDFLRGFYMPAEDSAEDESLIEGVMPEDPNPDAPRVIL
ncbi:MAG: hypothetical protein M3N93_04290 [Acidobacteriota bacterium]|nr:hypothetical protein [Acidobacteriota bacterium]